MNDPDAISGFLAGEPGTVHQVRQWIRGAFTPYRGRLGDEREDLEQEILLELTAALRNDDFRGQSRFSTYVRTYVHHKCIDRLRARSRRTWVDAAELDLPALSPSAYDEISSVQSTRLALRVVEEMPETCRTLWRMILDGMSYREMSERLGIAEGALRARVLRCRKRAGEARRRLLEEHDGEKV